MKTPHLEASGLMASARKGSCLSWNCFSGNLNEIINYIRTATAGRNCHAVALCHRNKKECLMKSNRMFMGAAVIGCLTAAMISGAAAQERDHMNGHQNARAGGNHMGATAPLNGAARRGGSHFTNGNRMGETATSDRREFVEGRTVGGERRTGRVAAETRYGHEWRGNRGAASAGEYDRAWRGDRFGSRDRNLGVGVAAEGYSADDGYYGQPSYAYAGRPLYAYAPGYDGGYSVGPYYAPGFSVGIGIGPVGIGIGPAWGW
jgi:hypothetical protein